MSAFRRLHRSDDCGYIAGGEQGGSAPGGLTVRYYEHRKQSLRIGNGECCSTVRLGQRIEAVTAQ